MSFSKEKVLLRQSVQRKILDLSEEDRTMQSAYVCEQLESLLPAEPCVISAYSSLLDEVNLIPFLTNALERGCSLYFPRLEQEALLFKTVESLSSLEKGVYGVLEPPKDAPSLDPAMLSLAIIPGRAFDTEGNRLGRGAGKYDQWICAQREKNPDTVFIGVCFDCQLVEEVPMEEYDEKMDVVIANAQISKLH